MNEGSRKGQTANTRPNIIFYFSDQQRWDTLGCYGQKLPVSPQLDRLAAAGTLFNNAFTCQPVCGPARACLQTGKYATQVNCHRNGRMLPSTEKTLAQYFNENGYETAYVGKWHLASDDEKGIDNRTGPVPQEYRGGYKDYWMAADILEFTSHGYNGSVYDINGRKVDFIGYRADCINNYAINYLRSKESDAPFFLFVSHIEPHHQNDRNRFEGPDGSKAKFSGYEPPGDLVGTEGDWRKNYPDYLGQCNRLDYNLGRLIDTLKEKGLFENTIIFYTSDHGSHFCTRNTEYKRSCHDACVHIPLIAYGCDFMGGGPVNELVSLIDLPATLLDCAGIPIPADFQGRSLKRLAAGGCEDWENEVFIQISESQVGRCIRTKQWKYSVRADADGWTQSCADVYYEDFLYDLKADPHERTNLVDSAAHAAIRRELWQSLAKHMQKAGEKIPKLLPFRAPVSEA